ncbi:MAG: PorP/SprF family type IX secretion system membrane protein [Chitinophagales bacterium]|nr:PorP/SprF family type IX secretion system membrane protein [Chitinophagaceae bacterium]MCB9064335.1 PorP/SprF family type IX secretion system membrane protein [Chitinophagales bacterium]
MKKLLLGVGAAMIFTTSAMAQDAHFTQYFASPLTLNPALTGLTQCDVRLAANYRSQWSSVSSNPYITGTLSYDMATMKGSLGNGDALGIGLLGLFDRSGLGGLQNITVGLSLAYHKALGYEKQHTLSFGLQGALVQKSLDFTKLQFEDQFNPSTGTASGTTGEAIGNADLTYPDFNAGLMYSGRITEHATAYVGFSYYHLTQPVETFLNGTNKINSRYTGYLGGSFDLNENIVLYASALYQSQASAQEIMAGAAVGFVLNPGYDKEFSKKTIFYLGGWYRYADALAPYIGFEWSKMKLGLSYDVNVSSFSPATNGNGAYEVSLIFNGCINKRDARPTYNFACPKF